VPSLTFQDIALSHLILIGCSVEFLPPSEQFLEIAPGAVFIARFVGTVIVGVGCYCDNSCGDGSVRRGDPSEDKLKAESVIGSPFNYIISGGENVGFIGILFSFLKQLIAAILAVFSLDF